MTATAPNPPATVDHVLDLLAKGTTTIRTAELAGWPRSQIVALINGQKGWLVDPTRDIVIQPARRDAKPILPKAPAREQAPRTRAASPLEGATKTIPIDRLERHPRNVRKQIGDVTELADSMRTHGVLQPPLVEPHPTRDGFYRIIAGHRRLAAAQLAGLVEVPVVVRAAPDAAETLELMLIENCHREGLSAMEKAETFGKLRDLGRTQAEIAKRTGFSGATVGHFLTLLDLDEASQDKVRAGELKVGDAIAGVRKARAKQRKKGGYHQQDWTWEPDHLTKTHPLAKRAQKLCDAREHTMRRRIGDTACGACWETAIRIDERKVVEAEDRMGEEQS